MKILKNLFLIFSLLFVNSIFSQVINFPDINFKNALLNHNPNIDINNDEEI